MLSALFLAAALAAGAVPAGVAYTEGEASVRFKSGTERDAAIGDILNTGDGVRTGADGLVELEQKGVTLRIDPGTVFTLMEKEQKGKTTGVLSLVLGSVKFRYDRLTGQEPLIQTASCIAGVRGTELTVYAGVDGSALIVVEKGAVEVEAEGASVAWPRRRPWRSAPASRRGTKFTVRRDQIDYRTLERREAARPCWPTPWPPWRHRRGSWIPTSQASRRRFELYQDTSERLQTRNGKSPERTD